MITPCTDKEIISRILNHPKVFDWLTDDNSDMEYNPVIHPSVIYLINDTREGVIRIDPLNSIACSVHIATTPAMWGNGAKFCKEAIEWGFSKTLYQKVVAMIPQYNKRCIEMVKKLGFSQEGVLTKSFLKNWGLQDQIVYGLCKGEK